MAQKGFWTEEKLRALNRDYLKGLSYRQLALNFQTDVRAINHAVDYYKLSRKYELRTKDKVFGHLDIESSQLNASFGMIISWAIKVDGENKILGDKLEAEDFRKPDKLKTDQRVVTSLSDTLAQFDVLSHFFGDRFDIPFIRSRALRHKVPFPLFGSMDSIDVWIWCKRNLKLHSHRLEAVADFLGVNSKTKLEPDTWIRGTMGDESAIREIWKHNREDVITLEKVYHILKPYSSGARRSI